ncbi:Zygote arrest protein 1 [Bulinus truncatus]|nr:Zygote arrest protein 1 [Bulinus truncatus]
MASAMRTYKKKNKLVRYFGFFRCRDCKNSWQSVHVYCDPDTLRVKYKQKCKLCKRFYHPYRTEPIKCRYCGHFKDECHCGRVPRSGPGNVHRGDLCQKCLESKIPCDWASHPNGTSRGHDDDDEDEDDDYDEDDDKDDDEDDYGDDDDIEDDHYDEDNDEDDDDDDAGATEYYYDSDYE